MRRNRSVAGARWLLFILCLSLLAPNALAKNFYKLETIGGDTYYVIALAFEVACQGNPAKKIRQPLIVDGTSERPTEWNRFPSHRLEKTEQGYDIVVEVRGKNGKITEKVAGRIALSPADQRCRHALRARGLGYEKSFSLGAIKWPLEAYD